MQTRMSQWCNPTASANTVTLNSLIVKSTLSCHAKNSGYAGISYDSQLETGVEMISVSYGQVDYAVSRINHLPAQFLRRASASDRPTNRP